jgi:hypothetical protein
VPNTDQSNFPVLISGIYSYLATTANGGRVQNPNGYDIVFTADAAGTNLLNFERETYIASTGEVDFWVRIPTLSHLVDTTIYLWYGSASVFGDTATPAQVWDSNYQGVWHLPNGSSLSANDSTGHNTGTNDGALAGAGQIGGAAVFTPDAYISNTNSLASIGQYTLEAWVKPNFSSSITSGSYGVVNRKNGAGDNARIGAYYTGGTGWSAARLRHNAPPFRVHSF